MSKLARARASMTNLRRKLRSSEPLRAGSAFGAGALVGALEARGTVPASVFGLPTKPVLATLAFAAGIKAPPGSTMASVMLGAGDGIIGAYGYAAGRSGTLIAGIEEEILA